MGDEGDVRQCGRWSPQQDNGQARSASTTTVDNDDDHRKQSPTPAQLREVPPIGMPQLGVNGHERESSSKRQIHLKLVDSH